MSAATVRIALVRERGPAHPDPITSAADVHRILGPAARSWDREHFVSIVLDGKHRVVAVDEVAVGTVTAALVHPREVLKAAVLANGVSIIVVHYVARHIMHVLFPSRIRGRSGLGAGQPRRS